MRGRADAWLSSGKHKNAIADYEEALLLNEKLLELQDAEGLGELVRVDDGALNNLAWVLATSPKEELRDGERAIELAKKAAEATDYEEAHILSTMASGYAETGDFEKAIEWVEKAQELNVIQSNKPDNDKARTDKQKASLAKELESYKKEEPWREIQDVENESKKKKDDNGSDQSDAEDEKEDDEKDDDEKDDEDKDDEDKDDEEDKK